MRENHEQKLKGKIFITFALLVMFAAAQLSAADQAVGDACAGITMESIKKHVPVPQAEIVAKTDHFGICEVILQVGDEPVPLFVTGDFIIAGEMYADKKQVTKTAMDKVRAEIEEKTRISADEFAAIVPELNGASAFRYTPEGEIKHRAENKVVLTNLIPNLAV